MLLFQPFFGKVRLLSLWLLYGGTDSFTPNLFFDVASCYLEEVSSTLSSFPAPTLLPLSRIGFSNANRLSWDNPFTSCSFVGNSLVAGLLQF